VCVWCVCVLFVHLLEDDLRYLFSPHQVNHGGVHKAPAHVSLYKSHTTEEPLRRPVGLTCTLEAGLPLRQRPRRNPWMRYSYPRVRPNHYDA
jgi:hypothetical protein